MAREAVHNGKAAFEHAAHAVHVVVIHYVWDRFSSARLNAGNCLRHGGYRALTRS
jgi:hypothetical protein